MAQRIPPSPVAPARWPSLVQSVGGETTVLQFSRDNAGEGHPNAWEEGVVFAPGECTLPTGSIPGTPCATDVFTDAGTDEQPGVVTDDVVYHWASALRSTFCPEPEARALAETKLRDMTSFKLEREFWEGAVHVASGLDGQYLSDGSATPITDGGASAIPLPYAIARGQSAFASCSFGARAMIHCSPYLASLWFTMGAIRRESGLLLDAFDNIVVAGSGYRGYSPDNDPSDTETQWAFFTMVVDVHLSAIETQMFTDQANNTSLAIAYRAGLVKFDPCCFYAVKVDATGVCG